MLPSTLTKELNALPADLKQPVSEFIAQLNELLNQEQQDVFTDKDIQSSLVKVCCCSQFVRDYALRNPILFFDLITSGDLLSAHRREYYQNISGLDTIKDEASLMKQLRLFRNREMVRIAWRDLAGWAGLDETLLDLTALAEICIQTALDFLYRQACDRRGTPTLADGTPINIVVLGMGKLGAWELNYSSDIDLIFAYAEDGVLNDRKETTYGEFFTRICRSLVKVLDETTVDGLVFRTDVRLRPFGDSGPLIMTFDGMENYYMTQAREWERYALIKARQVAGDFTSGKQLTALIKPFVYRRYLDYGAFEELRSLKQQITQELKRKDRLENIKLGPGGIREIEFIGQAFQLIRGGNEPELQQRPILTILAVLEKLDLLDKTDTEILHTSYIFLRRVENHIQQYQHKQTHDLPSDPLVQNILAYSMNYSDWASFKLALDRTRNGVHNIFEGVFSLSEQEENHPKANEIWMGNIDDALSQKYLTEYGFLHSTNTLKAIQNLKHSHIVNRLSSKGEGVLNRLIPQLIETASHVDNKDETLSRILILFEAVAGRNVYLSLLAENPDALGQLVKLSSASLWICEYLAQYPILFDQLLDSRSLYDPLQKRGLSQELAYQLDKIEVQNAEQMMIVLRQFKHINLLKVAAADIMGAISLMVVSDYLTYIAETVLQHVIERAWFLLIEKHGHPPETNLDQKGFAILGLGKLGGVELGYGSDLDMVFLYDCKNTNAMTNGKKPISCTQFYMRLGQKIRHILDTKMLSGELYEVDLRLRPSGDSGLLVTHINSYEDYMKKEAWTWEHQALVRGRFIAGDNKLKQQFDAIRGRILGLPRDQDDLKKEVRDMRQKMRNNLAPKDSQIFDLKQSKGGIADIEFIVQFKVLANTCKNKTLSNYTDNISLLDELAQHGLITNEAAQLLKSAYCQYRNYGHRQVLQGKRAVASNNKFAELRTQVEKLWHDNMD